MFSELPVKVNISGQNWFIEMRVHIVHQPLGH